MAMCPNCKEKTGMLNSLRKCVKCGTVLCTRCMKTIMGMGSACPYCNGETKKV